VAVLVVIVGAAIAVGTSTPAPWLYWTVWCAQRVGILWCIWALTAVPASTRVPIASLVAWAGVALALVFFNPVSAVFGLAVTLVLAIDVIAIVTRRRSPASQSW